MNKPELSTKERIVDAAIELFSEKGYSETTVREIGDKVRIKSASIYSHFKSKAEILDVILDEYFEYIKRSTVALETLDKTMKEMDIGAVFNRGLFSFPADKAERYTKILKVILQETYREPKAGAFVRDIMIRGNEEYIAGILDRLIAAGRIRPVETEVYAKILVSVSLSSGMEAVFYGVGEYGAMKRVSRKKAMEAIMNTLLMPDWEGERNRRRS